MRPLRARASVAAARSPILLEVLKRRGSTFFQAGSPKSILSWLHRRRWTRRLEMPKQVRGLSLAHLFNRLCPTVAPQTAPQQHPAEAAQVPVGAVAEVQEAAAEDARVAVAVAAAPALPLQASQLLQPPRHPGKLRLSAPSRVRQTSLATLPGCWAPLLALSVILALTATARVR
jgi:hypothetical protein